MRQTGANHNVVRIDVTIHNFRFVDLVKGTQCSLYVAQNSFWSSTQYSSNLDTVTSFCSPSRNQMSNPSTLRKKISSQFSAGKKIKRILPSPQTGKQEGPCSQKPKVSHSSPVLCYFMFISKQLPIICSFRS